MRVICTSPWIPHEWILAHGLEPHGIWSCEASTPQAPPSAGLCAFASLTLEIAVQSPKDAIVFSSHCDQLRRTFDLACRHRSLGTFLFNLPATWKSETAVRLFDSELERLGKFLLSLGGHEPSPQQLVELLSSYGAARRKLENAAGNVPARVFSEEVLQMFEPGFSQNTPADSAPRRAEPPKSAIPIALVGGPMRRADWTVLDIIEQLGCQIVLNATEPGERNVWHASERELHDFRQDASLEQLRSSLARACVTHCTDVFQRPNSRLYDWLAPRLSQRHVRGIVLWHYDWCDLWRAETHTLREKSGLPVLPLESNCLSGGSPRMINRLQAFLESLR